MENGTEHERKDQVGWGTSVVGSLELEPESIITAICVTLGK